MKTISRIFLSFYLLSLFVFSHNQFALAHIATSSNLVQNPSVELGTNGAPIYWQNNSWGSNNATFTYVNYGVSGAERSVRVDVSNYTNGDAKWFFNPVSVAAGQTYTYEEYSRSNVGTEAVVQYNANGNISYGYLGYIPASTTWQDTHFDFTVPSGVTSLTVFHVIASNGWLELDNVSLHTKAAEVPATTSSLVPNDSLEGALAGKPQSWSTNRWGVNTAQFTYETNGHTGSRSVKTSVSGYSSGDAKWYFEPIAVTPSTDYTFSDYYKSNTATTVVFVQYNAAGTPSYSGYISVPASLNSWSRVQANVTTASNTVAMTVYHVVNSNGWLQIDDLTINQGTVTPTPDPEPPVPPDPTPTEGNLIANADFEVGASTPSKWLSNNWGSNNATFSYGNFAKDGSKAARTTVTSYSSGDAKWYFNPVAVTPGIAYEYAHEFASTTATEVVVRYTKTDGSISYQYDSYVPSTAGSWSTFNTAIIPPADTKEVTVFHVVNSVGTITIDNASLAEGVAQEPNPTAIIHNGSAELGTNQPIGWSSNSWGSNRPTFTYVSGDAHDGEKSLKVTMNNYSSGDAKWFFEPVALGEGQYVLDLWYKTNVSPRAVIMFNMADGSTHYGGLPTPQTGTNSTTTWQHYNEVFTVPANTVSVSAFLFINQNGWLQTDDYSIQEYVATGFNRPLVTLTFDDGHEENIYTALPIMQQHGFLSTQCYATTFIENAPNRQQAINNVLLFRDAGHEICSHTVTHPFLTQLTTSTANYELQHSQSYLQQITGEPVQNFASPYGDYNTPVIDLIDNYYQAHRTVDEGYNTKDRFNIYKLKVQNILDTTTIEEFQGWLNEAQATNSWLILVYHRVDTSNVGAYDTYVSDFTEQMNTLDNSGLTVKTFQSALEELLPQL